MFINTRWDIWRPLRLHYSYCWIVIDFPMWILDWMHFIHLNTNHSFLVQCVTVAVSMTNNKYSICDFSERHMPFLPLLATRCSVVNGSFLGTRQQNRMVHRIITLSSNHQQGKIAVLIWKMFAFIILTGALKIYWDPINGEDTALYCEVLYFVEGEDEMWGWGPWNIAKNKLIQTYKGQ